MSLVSETWKVREAGVVFGAVGVKVVKPLIVKAVGGVGEQTRLNSRCVVGKAEERKGRARRRRLVVCMMYIWWRWYGIVKYRMNAVKRKRQCE